MTRRASRAAGFSLIELMVSMAIALVVTLAITAVMINTGGQRRTSASVNEVNQTGTYLSYVLDRAVRNAGSGFVQKVTKDAAEDHLGCVLNASRSGTTILPRPAAFGASSPFVNVSQQARLMPVLIGKDLANVGTAVRGDVLTVMSGTAGFGELPQRVLQDAVSSTTSKRLFNPIGYRADDLLLLALATPTGACMVQQVASVAGQELTLGGAYYNRSGANVQLQDFNGGTSIAIQLGASPGNPPQFQLYGVGANSTLFSYDLLQQDGDAEVPMADGVVEMRALYGVETKSPPVGTLDAWVDPVAGSNYTVADLTAGTAAAQDRLRRIVAIRVGLILRTSLQERTALVPTGSAITLFSDLASSLRQTRTLSDDERYFRFRSIEFTVPLRNNVFAPPA